MFVIKYTEDYGDENYHFRPRRGDLYHFLKDTPNLYRMYATKRAAMAAVPHNVPLEVVEVMLLKLGDSPLDQYLREDLDAVDKL